MKISALCEVGKPFPRNEWLLIMITLVTAIIYQALQEKKRQYTQSFLPFTVFNLCSHSLRGSSSCSQTDKALRGAGAAQVGEVAEPDFEAGCI